MPFTHRLRRCCLALPLLLVLPLAQAETHESLDAAVESLWSSEQVARVELSVSFVRHVSRIGNEYQSQLKNAPTYLETAGEAAWLVSGRNRFNAVSSQWGNLPRLDMRNARLLEVSLPKKRYQVLAGPGAGLFGVGDWQRYGFLHVIDLSTPSAPTYYPLIADAYLGERALGRLPGSTVLNYARLVPASRSRNGEIEAYEVTLYALEHKGLERVLRDGLPLSYALKHEGDAWAIEPVDCTPATTARDNEHRPFTTPLRPAELQVGDNTHE